MASHSQTKDGIKSGCLITIVFLIIFVSVLMAADPQVLTEDNLKFSMSRVTFWISVSAAFCVVAASLIATGGWLASTHTSITTLNIKMMDIDKALQIKITEIELDLETLKQEGTRLAQSNTADLKVLTAEYYHIKEALVQNAADHRDIINELKSLTNHIIKR